MSLTRSAPVPDSDIFLLFVTRALRMFAFGFTSVFLVLYLNAIGMSDKAIGLLLTVALIGDAVISLFLTTRADRAGRRRVLLVGAVLMIASGTVFALTRNPVALAVAAFIGVVSPNGKEVGPFLAAEQAALSQLIDPGRRTAMFARYALVGSLAAAVGALAGGSASHAMQAHGLTDAGSFRVLLGAYAGCGVVILLGFTRLSPRIEAPASVVPARRVLGLHRSRGPVTKLSALFALDAFAGGFVIQSLLAYWFRIRFGLDIAALGGLFFGANLLAAISMLLAARVASRIGLVNTMVVTHLPSNVLLCLVPLMPNVTLAVIVLLARFSISQMDVPTRQSYTIAVVDPDERAAAAGVTGIARSVGASVSPALCGWMLATQALLNAPLFVAGGLKIVYDMLVFVSFRSLKPPEERR